MGLYLDPPLGGRVQSKLDWLKLNGRRVLPGETEAIAKDQRLVFWQRASWGENAAVGFNIAEVRRLNASGVFEEVYAVPVESLRLAGVRGL